MKFRLKMRKVSWHVCVLAVFVLYNNCSGFSAKELQAISESSVGTPNGAGITSPVPTPTPPVVIVPPDPTSQRTKIFIAQGRLARTLISCDGGQTWIHDQSQDDNLRCWLSDPKDPRNVECDHNPYAGVGVDSGDGWIFANFGWGYAGSVRRSSDGVNWETLRTDSWGGGVIYALGKLLLLWNGWYSSSDAGTTWSNFTTRPPDAIIADHAHGHRLGNKFVIVANSGIAISEDQGQTWISTPSLGWAPVNIAEGNGRIVAIGTVSNSTTAINTIHAMSSADGGRTWTDTPVLTAQYLGWSQIVFNGSQFVAWASDQRWTSSDGINWTNSKVNVTGTYTGGAAWVAIGAIGFNSATGTYVSITTEWGYWYDKQRAYVSSDGLNWTELDAAHFKGGHPIGMITTADIDRKYCQ